MSERGIGIQKIYIKKKNIFKSTLMKSKTNSIAVVALPRWLHISLDLMSVRARGRWMGENGRGDLGSCSD